MTLQLNNQIAVFFDAVATNCLIGFIPFYQITGYLPGLVAYLVVGIGNAVKIRPRPIEAVQNVASINPWISIQMSMHRLINSLAGFHESW